MGTGNPVTITLETIVHSPVESVWKYWTDPKHIMRWNKASDDWHTPYAENDLRVGGKFLSRMEAKDGSFGFDFSGVYDEVSINESISYTIGDGRKVKIVFIHQDSDTKIITSFEAEETNTVEMQQAGWQAILDNFKKYVEVAKEE
ncbi:SRPBCC family protein [Paenibacillus elgii]|uniref:SRPBCC family protein n=1 Tax=Paenibacillus elgii TaxID=189691 RepID=UPI000248DFB3|nr:SRPBCC family protein [Paenibacillus elgii]